MSPQDLIAFIFDSGANSLQRALSAWLAESRALGDFVSAYRRKIRAKVRRCRTPQDLNDLLWELEVAHLLLKNPDFRLEYEAYGTHGTRSPDYHVITTAGTSFDVEATRIREGPSETRFGMWEDEIKRTIRAVPHKSGSLSTSEACAPGQACWMRSNHASPPSRSAFWSELPKQTPNLTSVSRYATQSEALKA